jgi:quinol monooxygenase YgiN
MEIIVQHTVRDYEAWKPAFDEHGKVRAKHGCLGHTVYRSEQDPNDITVITEWPSREQAREFVEDPSLREAMERGGVIGEPRISWVDEVETVSYAAQRAA